MSTVFHINIAIPHEGPQLSRLENDQMCWDLTVLCAFEAITGLDGAEHYDAFMAWQDTPAALPALTAYRSARQGEWISPQEWDAAAAFWRNAATANA